MQAQSHGQEFTALEDALGYHFIHQELLEEALTHPSSALVDEAGQPFHNQRLEFLGDTVLAIIIATALFEKYPQDAEGVLSRKLTALVKGETLSRIGAQINLGAYLVLSESEARQGGRALASNLENAMEALIAAVYLDGGLAAARALVLRFWDAEIATLKTLQKDPKTALQELVQGKGLPLPEYVLLAAEGAAHAPLFTVEVRVQTLEPQTGQGHSKKLAERAAAAAMLASILNEI